MASEAEAKHLVHLGQAVREGGTRTRPEGRILRLTLRGHYHPMRTFVAREGLPASIGQSQEYTTHDHHGNVNGLKMIFPEDKPPFINVLLDAIAP